MLRALWKIFIINILSVSLFAADVNQVANHIANLRARQDAMKPGTASYDAATYNQLTIDIKILEQQLATLTFQSDKLAILETKLAGTPEADPSYIALANQVANAQHDKQVIVDQISTASIKMANEDAQRAQEAILNGLNGNPAEELLAKSRKETRDAILIQEQALEYSKQTFNIRNGLYINARRAADIEISQIKARPEQYCTGLEQVPNPAYPGMDQPQTIPHYFCTAADITAVEDRRGVAAAKAAADAEQTNINNSTSELDRLKKLQAKLDLATEDNLRHVDQAMRQKISQSLGHDKIKGAVADMTKATLSDAPDVQAAAAEYQAAMEADITMVILGTVSTRLMNCSAKTPSFRVPDILTAATAGEAFVAGEIAEYASIYTLKNDLLTKLKDMSGDPYDKQIEALRKLLNMFQDIRGTTVLKKSLRLAAQNAYFAASTAAAMEARMQIQVANACTSGITSKVQKGASQASMYGTLGSLGCAIYFQEVVGCSACECCIPVMPMVTIVPACSVISLAGIVAKSMCENGGRSSVSANQNRINICQDQDLAGTHLHSDTTQRPTVTNTVSENITKQCWNAGGFGNIQGPGDSGCGAIPVFAAPGKATYSGCQEADDYFDKYNVWCPVNSLNGTQEAHQFSTLSSMGVAKEAVVNFIKTQSPVFADALDTQLASPVWRSVAWGALGSLVGEAMINNDVMLNRIDSDMKMIQDIIDGLIKQLGTGKLAVASNNMPGQADQSKNYATLSTLPSLEKSQSVGAIGASTTDLLLNNLKNVQLPPAVAEQVKQVARVGDQLRGANSISAEAMKHINALNANSNAIRSEMFASHNALQKVLYKKGSQYNLTKAMNQFTENIKNSTKDNLAKNNTTAGKMRAMMSGSDTEPKVNFGDYALASKTRLKDGANTDGESKFAKSNAKNYFSNSKHSSSTFGGSHNYGTVGKSSSSQKVGKSDVMSATPEYQGRLSQSELEALGRSQSGEKELASEKINEQNGSSLFEIISNRYLRTGYPRLLKKE